MPPYIRYDVVSREQVGRCHLIILCQEHHHLEARDGLADALQTMAERQQERWDSVALVPCLVGGRHGQSLVTTRGVKASRARRRSGGRRSVTGGMLVMLQEALREQTRSVRSIAQHFYISTTTLYYYLNGDGSLKPAGQALLAREQATY